MVSGMHSCGPHWDTWISELGNRVWFWEHAGKAIAVYRYGSATRDEVLSALKALVESLSDETGQDTGTTPTVDEIPSSTNLATTSD